MDTAVLGHGSPGPPSNALHRTGTKKKQKGETDRFYKVGASRFEEQQ